MKRITSIIYLVLGIGAIAYGITALLFPSTFEASGAESLPLQHILREGGAASIFVGLVVLWCMFDSERRWRVHQLLTVLTFLLAAIHWFEYLGGNRGKISPIVNSIPFLVLLTLTLLNRRPPVTTPLTPVAYPPAKDLLTARQVEKLELEIASLSTKSSWDNVTQLMPIIATLMGVLGFAFTVYVFVSQYRMQQEKDRTSRELEYRTKLQNQIRGDADELMRFTGDQKLTVARAAFLLRDMDTVLNTTLSNGKTMDKEFDGYQRSLTVSLMILVRDDCDFNNNPKDVGLANQIAVTWTDYSKFLRTEKDLNQLDHILFKYIEALKRYRRTHPGYLESITPTKDSYDVGPKFRQQDEEQPRYTHFIDLRDGIVNHLGFLNDVDQKEKGKARSMKTDYVQELVKALCNPKLAQDVLGNDYVAQPCQ
jgi:uncharacterized protein YjeT (DUF2065 family)